MWHSGSAALESPTSLRGVPCPNPGYSTSHPASCYFIWEAAPEDSDAWVLVTHVGDPGTVLDSSL